MMALAASRICWYSRSVSVCAGATVIESPVCTPIGSMFSIEQTIDHVVRAVADDLELEFLPAEQALFDQHLADARGAEPARDDALELLRRLRRSRRPRRPACTPAGCTHGRPDLRRAPSQASSSVCATPLLRHVQADALHRVLEEPAVLRLRDRLRATRRSATTPCLARMPRSWASIAQLSPVWPPSVGSNASTRRAALALPWPGCCSMNSAVIGSM